MPSSGLGRLMKGWLTCRAQLGPKFQMRMEGETAWLGNDLGKCTLLSKGRGPLWWVGLATGDEPWEYMYLYLRVDFTFQIWWQQLFHTGWKSWKPMTIWTSSWHCQASSPCLGLDGCLSGAVLLLWVSFILYHLMLWFVRCPWSVHSCWIVACDRNHLYTIIVAECLTQVDFGHVKISGDLDIPAPLEIGQFTQPPHDASSGVITVLDHRTIQIEELSYDDTGRGETINVAQAVTCPLHTTGRNRTRVPGHCWAALIATAEISLHERLF